MRVHVADAIMRRAAMAVLVAVLLTLGATAPAHPGAGLDWSSSGRLLAFWCDSGLYCVNLAEGGVTRLSSRSAPGRCSPDGTAVAWSESEGTYVQRADAAGRVRIADPGQVAGWSPDSQWVAVVCLLPGKEPDLFAASASGKGMIPLAPHPAWDGDAACSPDGRWIAFASQRDAERQDLWVVGWDGSRLARVTSMFEAQEPAWSPDGNKLAFSARETPASPRSIYYLDLRTRKLTRLRDQQGADCRRPRFAGPAHLAYSGAHRRLVDLRSGSSQGLPPGDLSPDGRMIAVLAGRPGSLDVIGLGGGGRRAIDKGVEAFAWSPDGRWVAYLALASGPAGTPVRELRIASADARGIYTLWSEGLRGGS